MRFDLCLTNARRVRWLLWGWLGGYGLCLTVAALTPHPPFWLLIALPCLLLALLPFWNQLMRQPAWVIVAADGLAWANPADSAPVRYQFSELRAYRFTGSKLDDMLLLYPQEGGRIVLRSQVSREFGELRLAFEQAVRHYNQAHPGAEVAREPDGLEKFFTSPQATQGLWGLLAIGAVGIGWGIIHDAEPAIYVGPGLLLVGYLGVWANFRNQRVSAAPPVPLAVPLTFAVWLTKGRSGWWGVLFLVVAIGIGMVVQSFALQVAPGRLWVYWVALSLWGIGLMSTWSRLVKWDSFPASITFEADQFTVDNAEVGRQAAVPFTDVKNYQYTVMKGIAVLRIERRDGSLLVLQAGYALAAFQKMAAEFERRFKAYRLRLLLARPAPRR